MPNNVLLNGKRIPIKGKVQERQVTPFSSKMSMGTQDFADFAPCSIREYSDLRGGLGKEMEKDVSDRFWWSESIETTKDGYITLGALVSTAGSFGSAGGISTYTLASGTGYSANDVLTVVQEGGASGTITINTVNGSGVPLTSTLKTAGTGYAVASGLSTTVAPSGGSGCTVSITALADGAVEPVKIIHYKSTTYAIGNSKCQYWTGSAWATADSSALATPTDALVFQDSTAIYLIVCNGSSVRYTSNGTSWSTLSTSPVAYLSSYDKRLVGINSTGSIFYYSDRDNCDDAAGSTMDNFAISGDWSTAKDLFEGKLLTTDEPVVYMMTDKHLVAIDFWTRVAYPMEVRYPQTAYALVGAYWNSNVYCGVNSALFKVDTKTVSQWGADADDGLPSDIVGYVYDFLGLSHWAVIAVSGGSKSTILKRHETVGGWHEIYTSSSNIRALCYENTTSGGRLWFNDGVNVKYITFPDKTHDVTKISGYTYAASGSVILPRLSKLSVIPKIALAIEALTEGMSADEKIDVYTRVDDTSAWGSAVGSFISSGHPTEISLGSSIGAAFNDIQIKLAFARGSTTTNSPKLKSLALKFIPAPATVSAWTFTIDAQGLEAKEYYDHLVTAKATGTLFTFSPDGDLAVSTKYVRVESMPSSLNFDDSATEHEMRVVVTEVE